MNIDVGIIMGSESDRTIMQAAADVLEEFGVSYEFDIISAHRTPEEMQVYAKAARHRGLKVIIAGAGGAAHLPGMVASLTTLPVIGVPVQIGKLGGLDALLSIAQMPKGIPVATMAVDNAANAGLLAVRILSCANTKLARALETYRKKLKARVKASRQTLRQARRRK